MMSASVSRLVKSLGSLTLGIWLIVISFQLARTTHYRQETREVPGTKGKTVLIGAAAGAAVGGGAAAAIGGGIGIVAMGTGIGIPFGLLILLGTGLGATAGALGGAALGESARVETVLVGPEAAFSPWIWLPVLLGGMLLVALGIAGLRSLRNFQMRTDPAEQQNG